MDKIRSYAGSHASGSRVSRVSKPGAGGGQLHAKDIQKNDFLALD